MAQLDQTATRVKGPPMTNDAGQLREYVKYLANIVAMLGKNLDYIINGNLDANNIHANSITSENIKAGSITADKLNVSQLSAISEDVGTVRAGNIIGNNISTDDTGIYPRIEFSSASRLLSAEGNANESISISPSVGGTPQLFFHDTSTGDLTSLFMSLSQFIIITPAGTSISVASGSDLNLQAGSGNFVRVQDWDKIFSTGDSQNLQTALNAKANASAVTGTVYVAATSGGPTTTPITFVNGVRTS